MLRYPSFKEKSCITQDDKLFICERCQRAEWVCGRYLSIVYCHHIGHGRMREANVIEYALGKKALKTIISWDNDGIDPTGLRR